MFSQEERCRYRRNQLGEVICQLRFPEILTIEANAPVDFQEAIRDAFPHYSARKENPAPKLAGTPGNFSLQPQPGKTNYQFVSADGVWRINLTSTFISLACARYTCWEEFAAKLDRPLAAFIQVYRPTVLTRVGLRYLNFISRKSLDLESVPYRDLIASKYLGILADEEVPQNSVNRCSMDAEFPIHGGCKCKLHAGPAMVRRNGQGDPEIKFVFDQDLFMDGTLQISLSAGALQTLHSQAYSIFRDAITDMLHAAMEPERI